VAWGEVCRPVEFGGLGIFSLKELGWAHRMRWLWLAKPDPMRPWSSLPLQFCDKVRAFFSVAMMTEIGNGASTLFWTDRWLHGLCVKDLAPRLFEEVPKRIAFNRNVQEGLTDRRWISDIRGSLSVGVIAEFLTLWVSSVVLQPEKEDNHIFRLATNGKYSAKAAYENLFWDLLSLSVVTEFGIRGLLRNVNFYCGLWLTKDVGLLIGCRNEDSHTLKVALFVIKNLKILITCWWGVFFLDNSDTDGSGRSTCRASLSLAIGALWIGGRRPLISCRALLRKGLIPFSSWGSGHFGTTGTTAFLRCSFLMLLRPLGKLRRNWSCGRWQGPRVFLS
jgi:hypothetical protein